jgi:hypothetical protein
MSELRDRNLLYARLEEVLGPEPAGILMQQLPPESNLATRSDVAALSSRIAGLDARMEGLDSCMEGLEFRMDRMERRMERFEDRLDDFHTALREQTRHFVLASTGTMVALTGVAFGAAALI